MTEIDDSTLRVQQLFVRHQGRLKAFVLALRPDFSRADDILQEVFLTVTAKAAEFRPETNFLAWARAIARFKLLEARRQAIGGVGDDEVLKSLAAACPDDWADDRKLDALTKCLRQLPPRAQEIIRLRYHREHSPSEIAEMLERTINSIAVALAKARASLRECIERRLSQDGVR